MTVSLDCKHRYASGVSRLREFGAVLYSDAPTALCGSVSGEH